MKPKALQGKKLFAVTVFVSQPCMGHQEVFKIYVENLEAAVEWGRNMEKLTPGAVKVLGVKEVA